MRTKPLPHVDVLRKILRYDPQTGELTRISTGKPAGGVCNTLGYRFVKVSGTNYAAHRLIWKMVHGVDPVADIDHIDGNRANNALENLRSATRQQNLRNRKIPTTNKSGIIGVYLHSRDKRWMATITVSGRIRHLGSFGTKEEAAEARRKAEIEFGYHPNHGRR